ncbi:MAG: MBOAT family protein [Symbiobacteriaceae bacterium]|nr:MBOAT family protein [Symbiobacteriaceae bacterium]
MLFSSLTFLCFFLPVFILCYFGTHRCGLVRARDLMLVAFSLFFYAWGEPIWVLALVFSSMWDFFCGLALERWFGQRQRLAILLISLCGNFGFLFFFKYTGFMVENLNALLGLSLRAPAFNLPLGISFYTFQTLSYTVDVYNSRVKAERSFLTYLTYVTMFPQLVAGPIIRYTDVVRDLQNRLLSLNAFSQGVSRFTTGLGKKVLLANPAGAAANLLLEDTSRMTSAAAWLGILFFSFQIYFDFSGYSDMAIGLGKMLGFNFLENFNYPYESKSVAEFWRRWHISLGSFFRDYVYIPLGGNRRAYVRNIVVVWFLTGFWHGASWNFILWGLYYGCLLLIERYVIRGLLERMPSLVAVAYTFLLTLAGWGLFYYTDFTRLSIFFKAFLFIDAPLSSFLPGSLLSSHLWLLMLLVAGSTSLPRRSMTWLQEKLPRLWVCDPLLTVSTLALSFIMLLGTTYNPFLYFRF